MHRRSFTIMFYKCLLAFAILFSFKLIFESKDNVQNFNRPLHERLKMKAKIRNKDHKHKLIELIHNHNVIDGDFKIHCRGEIVHLESYCNNKTMQNTQKVLSYSLFGNGTQWNKGRGPKYEDTIPQLARQVKEIKFYNDWIIRVYHDGSNLARAIQNKLSDDPQVQFCNVPCLQPVRKAANILGKLFRNIPLGDPQVEVSCFRDLDSALTIRESDAVHDWLVESSKPIHIMRDHPQHGVRMLAGMWCFRNYAYRKLGHDLIMQIIYEGQSYENTQDQHLLNTIVWRQLSVADDTVQHDSYTCERFPNSIAFPSQRRDKEMFIGCPFFIACAIQMQPCPMKCRPETHIDWVYC